MSDLIHNRFSDKQLVVRQYNNTNNELDHGQFADMIVVVNGKFERSLVEQQEKKK